MKPIGKLSGKAISQIRSALRSRYRIRILIAFFAVAVSAVGFIDVAVFRGLFSSIQEESNKETREVLENLVSSYENQLVQYQSQAQLLFRNHFIKAFLVSKGREDLYIDSIYDSMRATAGNLPGISSVILFNKDEILASFDTGAVTSTAKEDIVEQVQQTSYDKEIFFVYPDARKYQRQMILFWTEREFLYGPSIYGVALVINVDELQKRVLPRNRDAENPIYVLYRNGEIVASQNNNYKDTIHGIAGSVISQDFKEASYYEEIGGEKKAVSYIWSDDRRLLAIRIQEFATNRDRVNQALRTILLSTAFVISIITVLVWLLAGWIYRPLGKIFEGIFEIANAETKTIKGKNELTMATDALQDVNHNMNLLKSQIRSNAVVRFLRQSTSGDGLTDKVFEFGACRPKHFIIAVLRYSTGNQDVHERIMKYISETTLSASESGESGEHCYNAGQGEILILHYDENTPLTSPEQIRSNMGLTLQGLNENFNVKGRIGISQCQGMEKLPEAYRKAFLMTEYYILSKDILVIDDELLGRKKQGTIVEPEREAILQFVKGYGEGEIAEHVSRLLSNLTVYHITAAQNYIKQLVADVIRLSETVGADKNEQYEIYLEDFLTNQIFVEQVGIGEWLSQLFLQVQKQLEEGKKSTVSRILEDILEYINGNYNDCKLSVEEMADRYGWSVSYFSKMFNNYTGQAFPHYVNQLRLQKAREILLKESNRSVQEIAIRVGFNSSSYFTAAFRKCYGVTPSIMRKNGER